MANGFSAKDSSGSGVEILSEGVTSDPDLSISGQKPFSALMSGILGETNKAGVTASHALKVDISATAVNATAIKVDNSAVTQPVSGTVSITGSSSTTDTNTTVAASAASVSLLASNANRVGATFFNDSTTNAYIRLGSSSASTSAFNIKLPAAAYYEIPYGFTGAVQCIWDSAIGNMRVNELT